VEEVHSVGHAVLDESPLGIASDREIECFGNLTARREKCILSVLCQIF